MGLHEGEMFQVWWPAAQDSLATVRFRTRVDAVRHARRNGHAEDGWVRREQGCWVLVSAYELPFLASDSAPPSRPSQPGVRPPDEYPPSSRLASRSVAVRTPSSPPAATAEPATSTRRPRHVPAAVGAESDPELVNSSGFRRVLERGASEEAGYSAEQRRNMRAKTQPATPRVDDAEERRQSGTKPWIDHDLRGVKEA